MTMKYFRFLYGETGSCLMHFGELQDTGMGETCKFLYLRKAKRHVGQKKSEHSLFLCPDDIDLVILGDAEETSLSALKSLSAHAKIGTLIFSEKCGSADWSAMEIRETVKLSAETYQTERAGWRFLAKAYEDGTAALAHGLAADMQEGVFGDCVMNAKALGQEAQCMKDTAPDGYGCALGCALHQDYDVCKYHGCGENPVFRTGTLIFGGGSEDSRREFLEEARRNVGELRFFGLAAGDAFGQISLTEENRKEEQKGFRRYYIGLEEELEDRTIAEICRGGWYQSPAILREGEGICCSGLLKYVS